MLIAEIHQALSNSGIHKGDTLMIHADSVVSAQLKNIDKNEKLYVFINEIINFIGPEGTLIIPTFTYSFTKSEIYDVSNTISKVGLFSEYFRKKYSSSRTNHPIFSVVAIGKNKDIFLSASLTDCFGDNTVFDYLIKLNAKIMALGCDINRITFLHHIEQKYGVKYRYFKYFKGTLVDQYGIKKILTIRYFVGNLQIKYNLKLDNLKEELIRNNLIKVIPFGRFAGYTVNSRELFQIASEMLRINEYSLIEEDCEKI